MRVSIKLAVTIVVGAVALLPAATTHAALKCTAKISATDGTISVSGTGATGTVRWGVASSAEGSAFDNEASCVVAGRLKSCRFGPLGSGAAITPPELCRIWVRDDASECSAFLRGCTPGARPVGGPGLDPRFGSNTSQAVSGRGIQCVIGSVWLTAGFVAGAEPAAGQIISIASNTELYSLIGNLYGGDITQNTFALPDLRGVAPNGLTYVICTEGIFPARN